MKRGSSATIYYCDIGDYLSREEKLDILRNSSLKGTEWKVIVPNEHGDWINQRSGLFPNLTPLVAEAVDNTGIGHPIFRERTLGLVTSRDAWCFNSSDHKLRENINRLVEAYNSLVDGFQKTNPRGSLTARSRAAKSYASGSGIPLGRENFRDMANGKLYAVDDFGFTVSSYRPFFKQRLYLNRELNNSTRQFPKIYPNEDVENYGISITGLGSNTTFHALMTDNVSEYCLTAVNSIYIPRYHYVHSRGLTSRSNRHSQGLERVSNINHPALTEFQLAFGSDLEEDDLFHYTYGVLHSQQWRDTFADDLAKSQARIPMASSADDFWRLAAFGRELADLHVNYESVEPYKLDEVYAEGWDPESPTAFQVEKMTYAGRRPNLDRSRIVYNSGVTLAGIPEEAHNYRLGTRSALDWLVDRYRVTTHKNSGITNDPNDWSTEVGDPHYILDLVKRVTTVSVRTVNIMADLPELPI